MRAAEWALGGVTMSLHKLTAGSGYDYLTRQVAVQDVTEKGHSSLASYYTEKGETPGVWAGSGLAGIEGLAAADVVTAEQMKALFGSGHHPLAEQRLAALPEDATEAQARDAVRLGVPFKVYSPDAPDFVVEVARRIEQVNVDAGKHRDDPVSVDVRARIRSEVATEFFTTEYDRAPADARELAGAVARYSRPKTTAVAGFDLTFSPVKSVSTLWAIADPATAAKIERAHHAAVKDALEYLEKTALFTRTGTNGVKQVDVTGLVAAAFTHRDSRAGDPDLHTHVAVANKVQTLDGKWLSVDGRMIYRAKVTTSETYNTALERHAGQLLGLRFAVRDDADRRKRPIREVVGIDPRLNQRWSTRRVRINARRAELATGFQADHGRPPTPVEAIKLAQQATLETRDPKHEPRTLAEQRTTWGQQAVEVLGSGRAVKQMVTTALHPRLGAEKKVTARWVAKKATLAVAIVEQHRSTWRTTHLRNEAHRQVREASISPDQVETVVSLVVDAAVDRCVRLVTDRDDLSEPDVLRRVDGSSGYHVAGSDLFTSQAILDAEAHLLAAGGRSGGRRVPGKVVELALLESAANGVELNTGQAALVRGMATSGRRLELAIAPAGSGKTTAMGVLTRAWQEAGGTVIGLAPSAAAASVLAEQTGAHSDTIDKLVTDVRVGNKALPGKIGRRTLVLIDEAGMADTLTLDAAVRYILKRGASVRLIGDNQQLAAIGAGGVLRDIDHTYGSYQLSELMRFTDPAEAAATLALREGRPEALGFYLDHQRIHIGDQATLIEGLFTDWQSDRATGVDSIMLAPTRDQVADLNARARNARLEADTNPPGPEVKLADGNHASVGDIVITRRNERKLPISKTDWVKNNYRWQVLQVKRDRLVVQHTTSGLRVTLPADYVTEDTELGYASTTHTAQGLSVQGVRGLLAGSESRQQAYTMLTRGSAANNAYLVVASDGDPHNLIRPETIHPATATDILEAILARDESAVSATTLARDAADPATLLGPATARFIDALYTAAEDHVGADQVAAIDQNAEQLVPGIGDEPAWPALRAHLLLIEAAGHDATGQLADAVAARELDTAWDKAAVLDWRLDPTGRRGTPVGPLPWIHGIPDQLASNPTWGTYLAARADRVRSLASHAHAAAATTTPKWARHGFAHPDPRLLGDVAVWRAAVGVDPADHRPTGRPQLQKAAAAYQLKLEQRLEHGRSPALAEWGPLIDATQPHHDQFTPILAEHLAALSRAGINAAGLLHVAAGEGPLPDDHASAALWWRISRHVNPTVVTEATTGDRPQTVSWTPSLIQALGADRAQQVLVSPHWPALVAQVEHATARGWNVAALLDAAWITQADDVDAAQALAWRIAVLTNPPAEEPDPYDEPPAPPGNVGSSTPAGPTPESDGEVDLDQVSWQRRLLDPLEPTEADTNRLLDWADDIRVSPVTPERILAINEMAAQFYQQHLPGSWAHEHLTDRLSHDLTGDPRFRPGYAPAGWTTLTSHLNSQGVTDEELLAAGVASSASTGNLIDRFRDRLVLPILKDGQVLGFVGRRHPDLEDDTKAGPKYLNTPQTIVFHKNAQLYGIADPHMATGAIPVIVEGPIDAIAVTLTTAGAYLGVAPLGTSLTTEQAAQLASLGADPIVATDGDLAGQIAAERDYWLLTPHGLNPHHAALPPGEDPASLLTTGGPTALRAALHQAGPLAITLRTERLTNLPTADQQIAEAALVLAAQPPDHWQTAIEAIARRTGQPVDQVSEAVARAAHDWNQDRRRASTRQLDTTREVRARLQAASGAPVERWKTLATTLDPRLVGEPDWPATAAMLQDVHNAGHDLARLVRQLVNQEPLGGQPAQELRYRLVAYLPEQDVPVRAPSHQSPEQAVKQSPPLSAPTRNRNGAPRR